MKIFFILLAVVICQTAWAATTAEVDGKFTDKKLDPLVITTKNDGKSKDKKSERIESKGNGDNLKVEVINNFYGAQSCEQNKDTKEKTTKLPDGYKLTPNVGAHKYYGDLKVWNDARKFCEQEGAHLAIADSEEEMKIFEELIGTAVDTWVGFHDLFIIDDWVTVLDKPVPFYSWTPGNPDFPTVERCGTIRTYGFNNLNCDTKIGFICEVEISK